MRTLTLALAVFASPTLAHHEVVMATSLIPTMGGLALIVMAALAGLRQKLRRKKHATDEKSTQSA